MPPLAIACKNEYGIAAMKWRSSGMAAGAFKQAFVNNATGNTGQQNSAA